MKKEKKNKRTDLPLSVSALSTFFMPIPSSWVIGWVRCCCPPPHMPPLALSSEAAHPLCYRNTCLPLETLALLSTSPYVLCPTCLPVALTSLFRRALLCLSCALCPAPFNMPAAHTFPSFKCNSSCMHLIKTKQNCGFGAFLSSPSSPLLL